MFAWWFFAAGSFGVTGQVTGGGILTPAMIGPFKDKTQCEQLRAAYHAALALRPDYFEARINLSATLLNTRRDEEALDSYLLALRAGVSAAQGVAA